MPRTRSRLIRNAQIWAFAETLKLVPSVTNLANRAGQLLIWTTRRLYSSEDPAPIPHVRERSMISENMRRQFVTHNQLMSILREHGVETVSEVKAA